MLILIAESKTMAPCSDVVAPEDYLAHRPELEADVDAIMESLRDVSADELAEKVKLSLPMVRRLQQMVYEFPNKSLGGEAMGAFTGVVFKAFGYQSLNEAGRRMTCRRVRIISSLYGWLRPDDIVKPYRFDFTMPIAPGGKTLAAYWRKSVTDCLIREISDSGCRDILNLLPGDAARCIDWKAVEQHAKVWKADFKEVQPGGELKTPNAGRLKTLRGHLLRQIITEDISSAESLLTLASDSYVSSETCSQDGVILLHTVKE